MIVLLPVILLQMFVGNKLGEIETKYQPMKIAAAEAQWENCKPCSFSAFQIGGGKNDHTPTQIIEIPHLLSFLGTGQLQRRGRGHDSAAEGIRTAKYGPGEYVPNVFIQYWSMRVMAYLGTLIALLAPVGRLAGPPGTLERSRWFLRVRCGPSSTPFVMNTAGWLLTENGRQPWIVQGLMKTINANSPSVGSTDIWISLTAFVLIYIVLGAADLVLMLHYSRKGLGDEDDRRRRDLTGGPGDELLGEPLLHLNTLWFVLIAILWVGFFVLEGFDFGVGALHMARRQTTRPSGELAVSTIGPWWDGNEVWLIVAGAGTFAAFPGWYATMFSALYLALLIVLAG